MKYPLSTQAKTLKKGLYRHYKGGIYKVLDVVRHSETLEEYVLYQSVEDPTEMWVRPLSMFFETIEHEGKNVLRFSCMEEN